jgi:oligosaccharyltransferase complex subunit alpha (ribophorin I)
MIRPRFPLFGGWKTNYVIGYNVPSYEYLYVKGNQYKLRMRLLDHIYDNMAVDTITLRVILPERVGNVKLTTPYSVRRSPDQMHFTYLDHAGRPVVTAHKDNLCEKHIQNFEVSCFDMGLCVQKWCVQITYTFDRSLMIYEPLMLCTVFFALFALVIVYVRLDFSLSTDTASESRQKVCVCVVCWNVACICAGA